MSPTPEHAALAAEIASALGETGAPGQAPRARVEAQIAKMIEAMSLDWVHQIMRETLALATGAVLEDEPLLLDADLLFTKDEQPRMPGALFFVLAKRRAATALGTQEGLPRKFYETFCWREPQPKPPKPPPPKKEKKPKSPPTPKPKRTHDRRASNPSAATIVYVRRAK